MKIPKQTHLNQITFHKMQLDLVGINLTDSLWKFGGVTTIQTLIVVKYMWKFTKKQHNQGMFHNLKSHLACWHTKMYVLIRHIIKFGKDAILQIGMVANYVLKIPINATKSRKMWWKCMFPSTNIIYFCDIFFK